MLFIISVIYYYLFSIYVIYEGLNRLGQDIDAGDIGNTTGDINDDQNHIQT